MPKRLEVEAADAAKLLRLQAPVHAVVGEVGQRVTERGQLPVEHRQDARLRGVEDHIVQPVVAMHTLVSSPGGMCCGSHSMSFSIASTFSVSRGAVLLGPAADLALQIVARLAVVGQAQRRCSPRWCNAAITRFISS